MSKEELSSLLDAMLVDSAFEHAARVEREREERESERSAAPEAPAAVKELTQIEAVMDLSQGDLRALLAKVAPDDLLVILASSGAKLQSPILRNLTAESVRWLRDNLEHIDEVTNAERRSAEARILAIANELVREGAITLSQPEPEPAGETGAGDSLRELLVDRVRAAELVGAEALGELSREEPLVAAGLDVLDEDETELRRALAAKRAELEVAYAKRLLLLEEAIVAISRKESAESFEARVFG